MAFRKKFRPKRRFGKRRFSSKRKSVRPVRVGYRF